MRQAGEPSVEEILASIKKVIARDNREGAAIERHEREVRGLASDNTADLADNADGEEVLDLADLDAGIDDAGDEDPLVASATVSSIGDSLAALAMLAQPPAAPQIVRSGETSLEGLVRELLRPALAQWLDDHLPALVERMVAAEIARIVSKKS